MAKIETKCLQITEWKFISVHVAVFFFLHFFVAEGSVGSDSRSDTGATVTHFPCSDSNRERKER